MTALFIAKDSNQKSQKVLIYGASGGVGSYAVQLGHFGATVTGVCGKKFIDVECKERI